MDKQHTVLLLLYLFGNDVTLGKGSSGLQVLSIRDILLLVANDQGVRQDKSDIVTDLTWHGYDLDDENIGITHGAENSGEKIYELELAPDELIGGCKNGDCKFCIKKLFEFCLEATILKTGFELKIMIGSQVVFEKSITITDIPLFCLHVPLVGHVCLHIYKIDLKERSACVGVQFKVVHKEINLKIKCFKLGHHGTDTSLFFARLLSQNRMEDHTNVLETL